MNPEGAQTRGAPAAGKVTGGGTSHALAAVLLWSTVASAFKLTLQRLDPAPLLLAATLASLAFLSAAVIWRGGLSWLHHLPRRDWLRSAGLGLLNPCLYYLVLFAAYARLPAQQAQPLNYTWALVLAWFSALFLGQRLLRWDLLAGLICYAGVVVVATRGRVAALRVDDPVGVALALGSTLLWALYWTGVTRDRIDPVRRLFLNFLLGLPWVVLACAATDAWPTADPVAWAGAAYIGLFEMGLTFVLWLGALRRAANAARVANLIFLSPFLSLLFIHHLVGERIEPASVAGLAVIVAGLLLQRWGAGRAAPGTAQGSGVRAQR